MANRAVGQDALVGQTLGHYRIVEKIGAGGMGDVYRAHDEHLDRDSAIKVLPPRTFADESARKHFRKEALVLSKLNHPNIATIHDFDTQQGMDFLVMEYIPGITLNEKLAVRPLPEKEVIALGTQLAEGLSAAHEHGVVHRDLVGLIEPMLRSAGANPLALCAASKQLSDDRPPCLENPRPEGAESTLAENASSPFHAEPRQL